MNEGSPGPEHTRSSACHGALLRAALVSVCTAYRACLLPRPPPTPPRCRTAVAVGHACAHARRPCNPGSHSLAQGRVVKPPARHTQDPAGHAASLLGAPPPSPPGPEVHACNAPPPTPRPAGDALRVRLLQPGGGIEPLELMAGLAQATATPSPSSSCPVQRQRQPRPAAAAAAGAASAAGGASASASAGASVGAAADGLGGMLQRLAGGWAPQPGRYLEALLREAGQGQGGRGGVA